jgi:hypothetical protein
MFLLHLRYSAESTQRRGSRFLFRHAAFQVPLYGEINMRVQLLIKVLVELRSLERAMQRLKKIRISSISNSYSALNSFVSWMSMTRRAGLRDIVDGHQAESHIHWAPAAVPRGVTLQTSVWLRFRQ